MPTDMRVLRERLKQKLLTNKRLLKELRINDVNDLYSLSDAELQERLSPKVLGWLSFEKSEFEY